MSDLTTEAVAAMARATASEHGHVEYGALHYAREDAITLKRFIHDLAGYVGVLPSSLPNVMDEVVYLRNRVATLERGASDVLTALDKMLPPDPINEDDEECDARRRPVSTYR